MKRTLFAVMALLASGAALADECSSANTQTEMNQCAAARYQAADKKLNDTGSRPCSGRWVNNKHY